MNAASMTANDWPRRKSGTSGSGGIWIIRPIDVTSSGTVAVQRRHTSRTSPARSYGKKRAPA